MTIESLITVFCAALFCIAGIYFGTKNNNRSIAHDNEKEIWNAIKKIETDLKTEYWNADRTQQFYELSAKSWSLRFEHMESQIDMVNTKLDKLLANQK